MMLRHVFVVAILVVVTRCAFADKELRHEPPQIVVIEGRDIKAYADGGEFTSTPMTRGKIIHVEGLRRFIWQHWSEKTRGYVRIAMRGIDSTQTTYVFIEPADGSKWQVAFRGFNHSYPCPTCGRWFLSDTRYATSLQWTTSKDAKKLRFKDRRGAKIFEL